MEPNHAVSGEPLGRGKLVRSLVSAVLLYTLILLPNACANNMYLSPRFLSQCFPQSVDFIVSSIHLYL